MYQVLGKVLMVREISLPGFGSIYQHTGSNFILHSDNITRVLKIPYFPRSTQTKIVSPNSWYLDAIYWTFYILNLMNLIFACMGLIYVVKDTYSFYSYFSTNLNILKSYLTLFLFMIVSVAFIFAIGHSMSGTHSLAFIYLYIFLGMVGNFVMIFFQGYYNLQGKMDWNFRIELRRLFLLNPYPRMLDRLQSKLQCCGVEHPCDWELLGHEFLPRSCCKTYLEPEDYGVFDCPYAIAHHRSCANASIAVYAEVIERHSFMLYGKIFFQDRTCSTQALSTLAKLFL